MLRVYLDQNKWIDLALAATGHLRGRPFVDALAIARAGVDAGIVSFPLDIHRYWETSKRHDNQSRNDVAGLMLELSAHHTVTLPQLILQEEIDLALYRLLGRPKEPRRREKFGVGMRHIGKGSLVWPKLDLSSLPDGGAALPSGLRTNLEHQLTETIEESLLRAGPEDFRRSGFDLASSDHAQRFVKYENLVAEKILQHGLKGKYIDQVVRATDLGDIRGDLNQALERIGENFEWFESRCSPSVLLDFMDDLPSRYVTNVMRSSKHRGSQQKWDSNDFIDILSLPTAAVYCDVVVTERQWVHRLRQGKIEERYNTLLLSKTTDLVEVLIRAGGV